MPILVDCDDATRIRRLTVDRQQPELASANTIRWAEYLRREALGRDCQVLDTSELSLNEAVSYVVKRGLGEPL
ncbi:hypothetical protein N183_33095 [Sinorhizobium sp. Sb3]|nr:hypothetical protein N183_33095 [Sinorhizobium sp. Sb3]